MIELTAVGHEVVDEEADTVVIRIPKGVLILTKAQFIEALRRGKAYRRREALKVRADDTTGVRDHAR